MKSNYKNIFTPLTIKNMTMRNRIMMTPMGTNYGEQTGEMSFNKKEQQKTDRLSKACRFSVVLKNYNFTTLAACIPRAPSVKS